MSEVECIYAGVKTNCASAKITQRGQKKSHVGFVVCGDGQA